MFLAIILGVSLIKKSYLLNFWSSFKNSKHSSSYYFFWKSSYLSWLIIFELIRVAFLEERGFTNHQTVGFVNLTACGATFTNCLNWLFYGGVAHTEIFFFLVAFFHDRNKRFTADLNSPKSFLIDKRFWNKRFPLTNDIQKKNSLLSFNDKIW